MIWGQLDLPIRTPPLHRRPRPRPTPRWGRRPDPRWRLRPTLSERRWILRYPWHSITTHCPLAVAAVASTRENRQLVGPLKPFLSRHSEERDNLKVPWSNRSNRCMRETKKWTKKQQRGLFRFVQNEFLSDMDVKQWTPPRVFSKSLSFFSNQRTHICFSPRDIILSFIHFRHIRSLVGNVEKRQGLNWKEEKEGR